MKKMDKKGQLGIVNIIFFLIMVFIAAICTPIMNGAITDMLSSTNLTSNAQLVSGSIITFFWIGIVIYFFMMISPMRTNPM